ncbi:MAG TPA: response regulator, partial [Kofleriaceae bacterium]|nr:response regulator [Kofleriaceae bacterium]
APPSAPTPAPAAPSAPAPAASTASGSQRAPMIKGEPRRNLRLVPISEVAAQVASENGLDPTGPEMQALLKLSREVVERIVWEVVPDLAEAIIKHNLDKLTARAR